MEKDETDDGVRVETLKDTQARKTLPALCAEYRRLSEEAGVLSTVMQSVKADIKEMAKRADVKKIVGDGWAVLRVTSTRRTIKQELLLENGVDMDTILLSTSVSTSTSYQVRKGAAS